MSRLVTKPGLRSLGGVCRLPQGLPQRGKSAIKTGNRYSLDAV
jgi:hypothetical protein